MAKKILCINALGEVIVRGNGMGGTVCLYDDELKAHPEYKTFVKRVWDLQSKNDEYVRVWYKSKIWASMEFKYWTDEKPPEEEGPEPEEFWEMFRRAMQELRKEWPKEAHWWTMIVTPPLSMESQTRQVSVDVEVENKDDVTRARKLFKRIFKDCWDTSGVAVI